jgi:hypothetical protein
VLAAPMVFPPCESVLTLMERSTSSAVTALETSLGGEQEDLAPQVTSWGTPTQRGRHVR